jgi:lipid II:glycine glycyltransferase (peptidoglycan interpeptide bridge formation enzyme)
VRIGGSGGVGLNIRYIDPTIDNRWDAFVADQKQSSIFHTSAWARVIKDTYGYVPRYYVLEDEAGQFKAAIPLYLIRSHFTGKRLVGLPFSDYCWPLGNNTDISLILDSVKKEIEAGTASYLEIRGWQNSGASPDLQLVTRDYHITYILDLTSDLKTLNEGFHDNVRRGIKQAEKRGIHVYSTTSEKGLDDFYRLNVFTRKKLGVLPQPQAFFKNLYRHVISKDLGFVMLAESEGKIIAGVVFLIHKNMIYYKFNASDQKYLQKRPNHLITWEAIQYACENHFEHLDFGRCAPEEVGLRSYKEKWGAKETGLPYYYYPVIKGVTTVPEGSFIYKGMRRLSYVMPISIFKAAGSILYKHLG